MAQNLTWRWIMAAIFCLILYSGGSETYDMLKGRAQAQRLATDALQAWTDQYNALKPVEAAWEGTYPSQTPKDLHAVLQIIAFDALGLDVPSQFFTTTGTINPVQYNGQKLGIYNLCVQNGAGNAGLVVNAIDYPTLLGSLEPLSTRKDLSFTQINIQNGPTPSMTLANTCLLLKP